MRAPNPHPPLAAAAHNHRSAVDTVVPARGKACVSTGLRIAVPPGTYGRVAPRSGLAARHFIDTGAGVVDEDYRGELMVLLFNHSDADFEGEGVFGCGLGLGWFHRRICVCVPPPPGRAVPGRAGRRRVRRAGKAEVAPSRRARPWGFARRPGARPPPLAGTHGPP
jgi:hypothetical protein